MPVAKRDIKKIHSDNVLALGSYKDLFICFVTGKLDEMSIRPLINHATDFSKTHSNVGYICFVSKSSKVPDSQTRKKLTEFMAGASFVASVVIIESAKGFWGAAALGFMSALQSSARQSYPNKNFGTLEEASKWFANQTQQRGGWTLTSADISAAVESFVDQC